MTSEKDTTVSHIRHNYFSPSTLEKSKLATSRNDKNIDRDDQHNVIQLSKNNNKDKRKNYNLLPTITNMTPIEREQNSKGLLSTSQIRVPNKENKSASNDEEEEDLIVDSVDYFAESNPIINNNGNNNNYKEGTDSTNALVIIDNDINQSIADNNHSFSLTLFDKRQQRLSSNLDLSSQIVDYQNDLDSSNFYKKERTASSKVSDSRKRLYNEISQTGDHLFVSESTVKRKTNKDKQQQQQIVESVSSSTDASNHELIKITSDILKNTVEVDNNKWKLEESSLVADHIIEPGIDLITDEKSIFDEVLGQESSLRIWWYDAYEKDNQSLLYLFGKAFVPSRNKYESCCVSIQNVKQELYFLPRPFISNMAYGISKNMPVTLDDVCIEIKQILTKELNISDSNDYHIEICRRKYAGYLSDIPEGETSFIKLTINYNQDRGYFQRLTYGKTFSRIFGADVDLMQLFILRYKIMGPCWLEFKNVTLNQKPNSWCRINVITNDSIQKDSCIVIVDQNITPPPLTMIFLQLHTKMNFITNKYEVVAISMLTKENMDIDNKKAMTQAAKTGSRMTFIKKPYFANHDDYTVLNQALMKERNVKNHVVLIQNTERDMIEVLLSMIDAIDPDIIVGHDFTHFMLDILLQRMKSLKIQNWHRLGRIKFSKFPKLQTSPGGTELSTYKEALVMSGRLVCDILASSQTLVKSRSYDLTELARALLDLPRSDSCTRMIRTVDDVLEVVHHCSYDAYLSFALMVKLQILPLTKCLTNLSGNLWSHTMYGARLERVEYLLFHTFYERGYICPNKVEYNDGHASYNLNDSWDIFNNDRESAENLLSYEGGLVLDPVVGLYDDYVLLLDFNSLYPSIIQEYNVCFTTILRQQVHQNEQDISSDLSMPPGILPELVKRVVKERKSIKSRMKMTGISEELKSQLNIQQMAYKLTANSMYGCLGSTYSRFYAKPLAAFITRMGRTILRSTVDLARELGLDVIYGDTDSVMINTKTHNISKAKQLGHLLKEHVNRRYRSLELEMDGVFRRTLLLRKKKYAALSIMYSKNDVLQAKIEVKGLEMVRRDWCQLSHRVSSQILMYILTFGLNTTTGRHEFPSIAQAIYNKLTEVASTIKQVHLNDLIILQQLTKNLKEYENNLMHVMVAKDMQKSWINVKRGDVIPYVVCKDDKCSLPCIPSHIHKTKAEIDYVWYLCKQILPPVLKICGPIESIEEEELKSCLGIDRKMFKRSNRKSKANEDSDEENPEFVIEEWDNNNNKQSTLISAEDNIECVLDIYCSHCSHKGQYNEFLCILNEKNSAYYGFQCIQCSHVLTANNIINQLILAIRSHINRYYSSPLLCSEQLCSRLYPPGQSLSVDVKCPFIGCGGRLVREFNESKLYRNICYFSDLFDFQKVKEEYQRKHINRIHSNEPHYIPLEDIEMHPMYINIKKEVDQYISMSAYNYTNLKDFSF